jgi:hypothetical protein
VAERALHHPRIITGRRVENGRTRAEATVYCEKADGTKVIVASASALEG